MRAETLKELERGRFECPLNLEALPTQADFLSDFTHRFQGYGGGLGQGKTTALCAKIFYHCVTYPRSQWFVGRWDGKELRQTTMAEFRNLFPGTFFEKQNDQAGIMRFKRCYGNSTILYGDLKDTRINNLNLTGFAIDQAEEVSDEHFNKLVSRLRHQNPIYDERLQQMRNPFTGQLMYAPTMGIVTFNPEGTDSYIYRYFHPDSPEKKSGYQLYMASTYEGLRAGFITQDYVDDMLAVFPESARKRYLEGAWDCFSGRVWPQFDVETHVVSQDLMQDYIRREPVTIYESIDHGIINPTAVGWWAYDRYGNRFLVAEHYMGGGKPVAYHAAAIKTVRQQLPVPVSLTYLDAQCWARGHSQNEQLVTIAMEYANHGIHAVPGVKNWDLAYSRICQDLALDQTHQNPLTGKIPGCRVYVSSACTHYIKEKVGYQWKKVRLNSKQDAKDEPQGKNDHHMDEEMYLVASNPGRPAMPALPTISPLERIVQRRKLWNPLADSPRVGASWMSY